MCLRGAAALVIELSVEFASLGGVVCVARRRCPEALFKVAKCDYGWRGAGAVLLRIAEGRLDTVTKSTGFVPGGF